MSEFHTIHLHLLLLSGELLPEQEEAIQEHHRECSICRADLEGIRETLRQYQVRPAAQISPAVIAVLRQSARQMVLSAWQAKVQRLFHVEWRWLQAAALTAAIVILAVLVARSPWAVSRRPILPTVTSVEVDQHIAALQTRLASLESGSAQNSSRFDAVLDKELLRMRQRMQEWTSDLLFSENH
jgi:hypothetical protein